MREPALLDHTGALREDMFSAPVWGKAYGQMIKRHREGLDVSLGGLTDFTSEEMSHIAHVLSSQQGPVNEQALLDCVRIIQRESAVSKVTTEDDLLAMQKRMKERKGIKA